MPESKAPGVAPGPVTVFQQSAVKPGPVTVFAPSPRQPIIAELGAGRGALEAPAPTPMAAFGSEGRGSSFMTTSLAAASFDTGASAAAMAAAAPTDEWICEVCMRKFASQEMLQRHEQFSELHRENLAKLTAAI